ncbi:MAG: 50S ribosomal protein L6 [Nitrospirota bacterium]|nr:50S ribosomal protein L6 [Nitrospirota bacterium]
MSRIGKKAVEIPSGVEATIQGSTISIKGPKGTMQRSVSPHMSVTKEGQLITVTRPSDANQMRALHGVTRTVIANMVTGVTKGFEKGLELVGVGYKAQLQGNVLVMSLGFSHPIHFPIPEGVSIKLDGPTAIKIHGIDKALVGQVAADLRDLRKPEPYKGKGVKYAGEKVRRKEGKTGK